MYPDGADATIVTAGQVGVALRGRARAPATSTACSRSSRSSSASPSPTSRCSARRTRSRSSSSAGWSPTSTCPSRSRALPPCARTTGSRSPAATATSTRPSGSAALVLAESLRAADAAAADGPRRRARRGRRRVRRADGVNLDYLVVVDPATFLPVDDGHRGPALVLVAAVVGSTRLIDNAPSRSAGAERRDRGAAKRSGAHK